MRRLIIWGLTGALLTSFIASGNPQKGTAEEVAPPFPKRPVQEIIGVLGLRDVTHGGVLTRGALLEQAHRERLQFVGLIGESPSSHDPLLVLANESLTDAAGGYNAVAPTTLPKPTGEVQPWAAQVKQRGGLVFSGAAIPPTRKEVSQLDGWTLWDPWSSYRQTTRSAPEVVWHLWFPQKTLTGVDPTLRAAWIKAGNPPAVAWSAFPQLQWQLGQARLEWIPRDWALRAVRIHIVSHDLLPSNAQQARSTLVEAMGDGKSFIAADGLADSKGTVFYIQDSKHTALPGESAKLEPFAVAHVLLPQRAMIQLYRDGQLYAQREGRSATWTIRTPGRYHIEVRLWRSGHSRLWILSNAVHVQPATTVDSNS